VMKQCMHWAKVCCFKSRNLFSECSIKYIKNVIVFIARYTAPFDFDQQCKWSKSAPKKSLLADVDDVQGIHTSIIAAMSVIFIVIFADAF
jgi:hypothetical protein